MTHGKEKGKGEGVKGSAKEKPRDPPLEEGARDGQRGKRDQAGVRFFASLRMTGREE